MLQVCYMGSLLLSLLTGSLSVALVSLYRGSKAVLIIIACSCYLHSVIQLCQLFIPYFIYSIWSQSVLCFLQLLTLCCAIEFFHFWIRNMIPLTDSLHQHIMLAFESSLLFLLLINGLYLGSWIGSQEEFDQDQDLQDIESLGKEDPGNEDIPFVANNKFIPLKDSAQTLTPQLYNVQMGVSNTNALFNENDPNNITSILQNDPKIVNSTKINRDWMKTERSHSKSSEANSNASVIRHQLGSSRTQSLKKNNLNNKLRSLSSSSKKSSPTQSPLKGLKVFKFKSPKKFTFKQNKVHKENEIQLRDSQDKKSIGLNGKYLTRLSTISDLHKSFINLLGTSTSEDGLNNIQNSITNNNINKIKTQENQPSPIAYHHTSYIELSGQPLNEHQLQNVSPKLTQERIAIGRINNALLPPCLQSHDTNIDNNNNNLQDIVPTNSADAPSFLIPEMSESDGTSKNNIIIPPQETVLNDLNDLAQVPNLEFGTDKDFITPTENNKAFEYPPKISLDMWERNKVDFMRKASEQSQNSTLLSPFQFNLNPSQMQSISESPLLESKQHFSFPKKEISSEDDEFEHTDEDKLMTDNQLKNQAETDIQANKHERNISDTISELDKYLNDFEASSKDQSQILEESLQQENNSTTNILVSTSERISCEFTRTSTRHSPTKSLVSIISGGANGGVSGLGIHRQRSQNLTFGTPNHARANSQYSFPQNVNISTQSSPTKQRFKRIGKKLSLSNISDNMFSDSESKYNHSRNQSVEFTYINDLQNNRHSPSKSISVIPTNTMSSHIPHNSISKHRRDNEYAISETPKKKGDRRHSMAAVEKMIRSASSVFYKQSNVNIGMTPSEDATNEFVFKQPVMENLVEERKVSNQTSLGSDNIYPDIVMSEYDREKWNTMKDLNMIDNEGHLKDQAQETTI